MLSQCVWDQSYLVYNLKHFSVKLLALNKKIKEYIVKLLIYFKGYRMLNFICRVKDFKNTQSFLTFYTSLIFKYIFLIFLTPLSSSFFK